MKLRDLSGDVEDWKNGRMEEWKNGRLEPFGELRARVGGWGGPEPAVSGELRSLGSNEGHEVGLRRLELVGRAAPVGIA